MDVDTEKAAQQLRSCWTTSRLAQCVDYVSAGRDVFVYIPFGYVKQGTRRWISLLQVFSQMRIGEHGPRMYSSMQLTQPCSTRVTKPVLLRNCCTHCAMEWLM